MNDFLVTNCGRGRELCDLLRRELNIPETAQWFQVRFDLEAPVTVQCGFLAVEKEGAPNGTADD